jgi:hypothetical protein
MNILGVQTHTFKKISALPTYAQNPKKPDYALNCTRCHSKTREFCVECSLLMLNPIIVCYKCKVGHENLFKDNVFN